LGPLNRKLQDGVVGGEVDFTFPHVNLNIAEYAGDLIDRLMVRQIH
jgi:hypothetical protein